MPSDSSNVRDQAIGESWSINWERDKLADSSSQLSIAPANSVLRHPNSDQEPELLC